MIIRVFYKWGPRTSYSNIPFDLWITSHFCWYMCHFVLSGKRETSCIIKCFQKHKLLHSEVEAFDFISKEIFNTEKVSGVFIWGLSRVIYGNFMLLEWKLSFGNTLHNRSQRRESCYQSISTVLSNYRMSQRFSLGK